MRRGNYSVEEEKEAFIRLYKAEYEGLMRYASAILRGRNSGKPVGGRAEEAVQEMFVFAWENRGDLLSCEKPAGWLYNALHYKVLELLREENKWTKRLLWLEEQYSEKDEFPIRLEVELDGIVTQEELDLLKRVYVDG